MRPSTLLRAYYLDFSLVVCSRWWTPERKTHVMQLEYVYCIVQQLSVNSHRHYRKHKNNFKLFPFLILNAYC